MQCDFHRPEKYEYLVVIVIRVENPEIALGRLWLPKSKVESKKTVQNRKKKSNMKR